MTTKTIGAILALATLVVARSAPVAAHHAFAAEFDATAPITLTGTITKVERINPHGWIYIDVKGADGKVANWAVETGAPTALAKAGITRTSIPVGEPVVITGYRAKDGSNTINGNQIKFQDGRNLNLGSSGTGAPYEKGRSGGDGAR